MKKNLNEIFDGFTPEELDKLSDELNAEKLPDEVMSAIKDKVYAKTNIKNTLKVKSAHRTPRAVWLRTAAVAACFAVIVGVVALFPTLRRDDGGALPDASPDGGEASTTTTTTTTAKDYTPKKLNGFSSGGSGVPPITVKFESIQEFQDFIKAANGTEEEFEKYAEQAKLYYAINQKVAIDVAHNLDIINFPLAPFEVTEDNFTAIYYLDRNELVVFYLVDGFIKYSFTYYYDYVELPKTEKPLFKEDVPLEKHSLDLYDAVDHSRLFGFYMDNRIVVQAIINTEDYQSASFEGITFKPLADIK